MTKKRPHGDGGLQQRGENSFRLRYRVNGKRHETTFHGSPAEAKTELRRLLHSGDTGSHVEPTKETVGDFVASRIDQWEASGSLTARSAARYREILRHQIVPHLGDKLLQRLRPADIEAWHTTLQASGLQARTVRQAHRVLNKALNDACRHELIVKNVCTAQPTPKVEESEVVIVQDIPDFIAKLKTSDRLYVPAMISLFTGMRMGEILALRWSCIDLDKRLIQVREAVEHTKVHGTRFKAPKSKAGRRDITLPDVLIDLLRSYRREQLELRMRIGIGKLPDDALLFSDINGNPLPRNQTSTAWHRFAEHIGMPEITFHALRHTHASQLIDAGVDIVTISKRLGHAKPDITL
jgi:integrase